MITTKKIIYHFFNVEWKNNKRLRDFDAFNSKSIIIVFDFVFDLNILSNELTHTQINNKINKLLNEIVVQFDDEIRQIVIVIFKRALFKLVFQNNTIDISSKLTSNRLIIFTFSSNDFNNDIDELNINIFSIDIVDVNTFVSNIVSNIFSSYTIDYIQFEILKQHFYLRSRRDFLINFLTLFVKCFSMNFYKFKNYNKVIIDIQHKQN